MSKDGFFIARYLELLRRAIGDSDFGYRVQAMFANLLVGLGWAIVDIKPQGHPDIVARQGERRLLVEVEFVPEFRRKHMVKQDDLDGTHPMDANSKGYLALLDLAPPVSWLLLDSNLLRRRGTGTLRLVTLHAMADRHLSRECSQEFVAFVSRQQSELQNLSFHTLCDRAMAGETS